MATGPTPIPLGVVPDAAYQEIENTIDAPASLAAAVEEFRKERVDGQAELANSLGKDLAIAPLKVESAIERYNTWKALDEALVAKINAVEELLEIVESQIAVLEATQPNALRAAIQRRLDQLESEAAAEKEKAARLKEQIEAFRARLQELTKQAHQAATRNK